MNKEAIKLLTKDVAFWDNDGGKIAQIPRDDYDQVLAILKEQPPAGDVTNEIRRRLNDIGRMRQLRPIEKSLWNILDRLDRSEASREELLTACRQALNKSHNPEVEKILDTAIKKGD